MTAGSRPPVHRSMLSDAAARLGGLVVQRFWSLVPDEYKTQGFPASRHYDIRTPEYATFDSIQRTKWGVDPRGRSFIRHQSQRTSRDIVTGAELVRTFVDIVSRTATSSSASGQTSTALLPRSAAGATARAGSLAQGQQPGHLWQPPMGDRRDQHNRGHRSPLHPDGRLCQRHPARYADARFGIRGIDASAVTTVRMLGLEEPSTGTWPGGMLHLRLPARMPVSPAHVLSLGYDSLGLDS